MYLQSANGHQSSHHSMLPVCSFSVTNILSFHRIYWTDSDDELSTLESSDLNGNDRLTVISLPRSQGIFYDLAIFQVSKNSSVG